MNGESLLLSTTYLGPVSYYTRLAQCKHAVIEQCDHYVKQTYRNRCRIATANGTMDLSVPIIKSAEKQCTKDVRIAYLENWQLVHWRAIESAYNTSPFFEYYRDDIEPLYLKKTEFLIDFNQELMHILLPLLGIKTEVTLSEEYTPFSAENPSDLREHFSPKHPYSGELRTYYQVFASKNGFLQDMSVIDLLFNMGPESILLLTRQ